MVVSGCGFFGSCFFEFFNCCQVWSLHSYGVSLQFCAVFLFRFVGWVLLGECLRVEACLGVPEDVVFCV